MAAQQVGEREQCRSNCGPDEASVSAQSVSPFKILTQV